MLAGLDLLELAVVAGMAWVGVLASAVQASGSQSYVPWEVDNPYAQHMSYPSVEQLAFPDMMVDGPDVLGGGGVLVTSGGEGLGGLGESCNSIEY